MENTKINFVTKFKFLGLILDGPHLNRSHHLNYLKDICSRKLNILRSLTSKSWGANRRLLTTFYNSFIQSKISYGIEIYSSACKTKLKTLEIIQNTAIRIITGLYRTTPVITLHLESQISSIFTNIEFKIIKYFYKIQCSNKTHILHSLFTSHENLVDGLDWSVLPHKSPFRIRAKHTCIKYDIREEVIEENSTN